MTTRSTRKSREAKGRRAEWIAAAWLWLRGYRLLGRRVRAAGGEIDLVMRDGDSLVFVEVKARATLDSGLLALHPAARRRIDAASRQLAPHWSRGCVSSRIDVVVIRPWRWPVHFKAAWREGDRWN
ncbi:YraN family protein [Sandarakinorhabdus sp.]|uniref:YraN family protein n=1 Tax=Sandarakinorhabdus sp. TaxID=1916663 RepID=UPI00286DCE14|nr:YraN family protein [Sandarakinorhabdus sp.]